MKTGHHTQDDIVTPFEIVDKIKILGVVFENGKRAIDIDENWTGRIEKLTCIIQLWSKRDLSGFFLSRISCMQVMIVGGSSGEWFYKSERGLVQLGS